MASFISTLPVNKNILILLITKDYPHFFSCKLHIFSSFLSEFSVDTINHVDIYFIIFSLF